MKFAHQNWIISQSRDENAENMLKSKPPAHMYLEPKWGPPFGLEKAFGFEGLFRLKIDDNQIPGTYYIMCSQHPHKEKIKQISEKICMLYMLWMLNPDKKTAPGNLPEKCPFQTPETTFDVAPGLNSVVSAGRFAASWLRY